MQEIIHEYFSIMQGVCIEIDNKTLTPWTSHLPIAQKIMWKKESVLLLKPLQGKGNAGDVIDVKTHYANYVLLPQWVAVRFDKQAKNQRAAHDKKVATFKKEQEQSIESMVAELKAKNGMQFIKTATENWGLYDSITSKTLAQYAKETFNVTLSPEHFVLDEKIEATGEYEATFMHWEIKSSFPVVVTSAA